MRKMERKKIIGMSKEPDQAVHADPYICNKDFEFYPEIDTGK